MRSIEIKDLPAYTNSIVCGQYPRAVPTGPVIRKKKYMGIFPAIMEIDEPDSDCGSKHFIPISITDKNKYSLLGSYIDINGQLEMLTQDNISSYVGQIVNMRSPVTCINQKICSKCMGKLAYDYLKRLQG